MATTKILAGNKEHFESLINDFSECMELIILTATTAILADDSEEVRIDLI